MRNIILTGFMGTGKSAVGRILALRLGFRFIDLDEEIEKEQGISISEIFRLHGEAYFREAEAGVIRRLSQEDRIVMSTGGGAVLRQENMENLRKKGIVICLTATPVTILERTKGNRDRPLLQVENPLERIRELLELRGPSYSRADITIDTENKSPHAVAEEVVQAVSMMMKC